VSTDDAPKAIGPYSQAVIAGDLVFVAGQGPIDPATGRYEPADIRAETKRALENVKAILEAAGSSLDRVVKVTVYLRDLRDFEAMNEVYASFFEPPYPARATIQAAALPKGFAIEIDAIARR
jgi:2-iminobutanoate/2-iminopropanoate deaminase